ncbi:MAG: 5'-nucleotidase C-terminal domain-containing protein [Bryobacteraceae bacterium]|nr:5'-nucleotidase C-terminal domain-containing protein [Bryobacteraceae bacterium]
MRFAVFALLALTLRAESVTVQILATTDLHGHFLPWDYYTAEPAQRGFAKIATLIKQAKAQNPNTLLIDVGDTIQGTALEALHAAQVRDGKTTRPDPMMAAMNRLGYASMTVGNHEYNFGLKVMNKARDEAKFPWLSANTVAKGGARPFDAYAIRNVGGVRVAVFGITTPNIPMWEKPEHFAGYTFSPAVAAAKETVEKIKREGADLIVGAVHAGLTPKSGEQNENMVDAIAKAVPDIDAIFYGHTHQVVEDMRVGEVMLVQPRNWGGSLARATFTFERKEDGNWLLVDKKNKLLPVTAQTPADPEILAIGQPYHNAAENWLSTPVATAPAALDARLGRTGDNALVDAIHEVQMHYGKADVSFTSLFNLRLKIAAGPVTVREIAALYLYENELYTIEGTGAMVRAALENSARYYLECPEPTCAKGPLTNRSMAGYNFDMAQGVEYEIDLREPHGSRIKNLKFKGAPLRDDQKLRIAVNNYRAGGSNGFTMFRGAPVVWRSNREIRDMIVEYYSEKKTLPAKPDGNWRIVPDSARRVIEGEAQ